VSDGRAADSPEVSVLIAKGERLLRESRWSEAAKLFEELAGRYPDSDRLGQFIFLRAKAEYYNGEYNEAVAGFSYFLARFHDSQETPSAYFLLGNAYYRQGQVTKAVQSYLECYRLTEDSRLTEAVLSSLHAAFTNARSIQLSRADFDRLPSSKKCTLAELLADVLEQKARLKQAQEVRTPSGSYAITAGGRAERLEIAMVLPFSGELHTFGEDIYNGAVIAAELYRNETGKSLRLAPHDTKGDPINAARVIKELLSTNTIAAVGPLSSDEAAVTSAGLSCGVLPLLVPAATEAGFTLLSETSFQLSPNIELQGIRMAEYAVNQLHADSAAVITSTNTDHLRMARAFTERFEELGGTVIGAEYYRPRDKDFGPYIRDLKAILLGKHPDSLFFINENGDTLDADGLPAHVDCLFLPGTPNQVRLLLPQINFYNLTGTYLGSDSWSDEAILKLGDKITKGAVFPSPFLMNATSQEYLRFAAEYDARFARQPSRLAALGYDAVRLITRLVGSGADTRESLAKALAGVRKYEGASGTITFGSHRENIEVPLFRIRSEQAIALTTLEDPAQNTDE
jgi:branched-chain amino acid transport system substrate-binding protein